MLNENSIKEITRQDFDKALQKAFFSKIISKIKGEENTLLSLQDVIKYIKVKNESYIGLQYVKIDNIIGSEGRYNDFNRKFLPKRQDLRSRWQRVDEAHYKNIYLPPIQLYKLGEAYFVRDGNHRVSVAREQGKEFIDAEVTEIKSDIKITPDMTKEELIKIVIAHEKENFLENTKLDKYRNVEILDFTSPGRFEEIYNHICGHQYYLGIEKKCEVSFEEAMLSWYDNIFLPIVEEIENKNILLYFPGRTVADLYVWIVRHWDDLKRKYGENIKIEDAVKSYSNNYGENIFISILKNIRNFIFRK